MMRRHPCASARVIPDQLATVRRAARPCQLARTARGGPFRPVPPGVHRTIAPANQRRTPMSKDKTPQQHLWEMIKDIRFGMLTHRHPDGGLHSHPLTTQNKELGEKG